MIKALSNIKCFLLDMDGTTYLGNKLLPGAIEFLDYLKQKNIRYIFLTNNSSKSARYYINKLKNMGIKNIDDSGIFTSGQATAIYIKAQNKGKKIYLVGTEELQNELTRYSLEIVNETDEKPDYVVVGFDTTLNYDKLWKACDYIRSGVTYIATHPDFNCPIEGGFMPDCGAIIAFIKASTGKEPHIIGKPYGDIINSVFQLTNLKAEQLAIVGDRLYTDIKTGINAKITSILVLSGETTCDILKASDIKPDIVVSGIGDIIDLMV